MDAKGKEDVRTVLHLHPFLAPYKCAVLPLSKKLSGKAQEIRNELAKDFMVDFDDAGSIGKRYPPSGRDRHPAVRDGGLCNGGRRQDPRRQLRHRP